MSNVFRVAVLECDTPIDPVKEKYGTYGDIFSRLLNNGLSNLEGLKSKPTLDVSKWDVVDKQEYPELSEIDGILMTGSKHDSFESHPWILKLVDFTKKAFDAKKPIVGICFGHQILARAMGAKVGRSDKGWEVSADNIDVTDAGFALFDKSSLTLHQMHRDVVFDVPEGFQNLGTSPRCDVQGLYLPNRAFSVQAHPEFDDYIMDKILKKRHGDGIFSDDMYEDGNLRASLEHDGLLVATTIWKFFLVPSKA
ncbi:class I glutamine amidotransferase-like protein [Aaosphaeria arxii CBS 175.79]|uniref:Class I glutamine amidotransferase-like protein n=1 Tax=Aaosphaeria arxii CBS 175.79 TaxID=1450172 RepID=A0A6A5XWH0_9PLEO|nr:class I glutamine amidotransferase-like protein [Aaosphaeria arxii CBS 175.79]KAF2017273.1 class I glutamine amidotransferase-like protein [Aaosphaeria arxii CBS 175.79]